MTGREYFEEQAQRMNLKGLRPDEIASMPPDKPLRRGRAESKLGGNLTSRDLTYLTPAEAAKRHAESEEFLQQPAVPDPEKQQT